MPTRPARPPSARWPGRSRGSAARTERHDFATKNPELALARETKDWLRSGNRMGRAGHPDEVAKAVLFLAFDATYTTGAELAVDGGASQL